MHVGNWIGKEKETKCQGWEKGWETEMDKERNGVEEKGIGTYEAEMKRQGMGFRDNEDIKTRECYRKEMMKEKQDSKEKKKWIGMKVGLKMKGTNE